MGPDGGDAGSQRGAVLVVDDEPAIAALIRMYLERDGFRVVTVTEGEQALRSAAADPPLAVILDIGLPDLDGREVCRRLRAVASPPPILFVTARDEEVDRIVGLEIGGDDYIVKPFSPRELVARVKAVLRRAGPPRDTVEEGGDADLNVGRVRLSPAAHRVWAAGSEAELTATEFALLEYLMRRPGRVLTRAALLEAVWGYQDITSRTVDVHVAQLRGKLGAACPIRTVRGVGYAADATAVAADGAG